MWNLDLDKIKNKEKCNNYDLKTKDCILQFSFLKIENSENLLFNFLNIVNYN